MRDGPTEKPKSANAHLKTSRRQDDIATEYNLNKLNLANQARYLCSGSNGHHGWTIDEEKKFESRHPVGTKAQLALTVLTNTGQSRSDIVLLGPHRVKNGSQLLTQTQNTFGIGTI